MDQKDKNDSMKIDKGKTISPDSSLNVKQDNKLIELVSPDVVSINYKNKYFVFQSRISQSVPAELYKMLIDGKINKSWAFKGK